jgi:hypothetical protein
VTILISRLSVGGCQADAADAGGPGRTDRDRSWQPATHPYGAMSKVECVVRAAKRTYADPPDLWVQAYRRKAQPALMTISLFA